MQKLLKIIFLLSLFVSGCNEDDSFLTRNSASFTVSDSIVMVSVQGGKYVMGDNFGDGYSYELPVHNVTLSDFKISKTEITQKQWSKVMGSNSSYFLGENLPVELISWFGAIDFCNKLSISHQKTPCYSINKNPSPTIWIYGKVDCDFSADGYRLPTEAEWEYAARDGGQLVKWAGINDEKELVNYAWYNTNSNYITHGAAEKRPNSLGLFDMTGNVWELCWDWFGSYTVTPQINPQGPATGVNRVIRGGSWMGNSNYNRVSLRSSSNPNSKSYATGFRIVQNGK